MNTRFKVFASYYILQYLCDFIHGLMFVIVSKYRKSPKLTNIVITVAIGDMDIDIGVLVKLRKFIEEESMVSLCFVDCGTALTHKYFQMVMKGKFVVFECEQENQGLFGLG